MPNHFFQFKEFTVFQDQCAMKVCTDACILGAWTAKKAKGSPVTGILDIGTGTGLLSLMMAQSYNVPVDAVEISENAAGQARENFSKSPWAERLNVIHTSVLDYDPVTTYDLIICNPPFYENDLKSPGKQKNDAKHDTGLKLDELLCAISRLLAQGGVVSVLLPFSRAGWFEEEAVKHSLVVIEKMMIRQTPAHGFFRSLILLKSGDPVVPVTEELIIHDENRNYTEAFKNLLKDYYLGL